jgi:trimethylamine--corrinoid protein Co-methyltransferase
MDLCHYDVPILAFPMAGAGSTAPASLASTIAMANAEILSIFVLFQCENPGVPIIYGDTSVVTNRRSGLLVCGSAEAALISAAMQEMAAYYGLPSQIGGCGTDAKEPGIQAVIEKTLTTLPLVMMETDIIQGIGTLDAAMLFSLEQMLIDEEIAMMCKRLRDGINFSPEMDFFEDIKAVGPTGHFLKQKNTRAAFRSSEYYNPTLADRDTYEDWIKLGSPDMYKNANKRVTEILASEHKSPLPINVIKEIDEIVEEAMRTLD